ncbi:Mth938-like domain-containing protein [Legionella spiritensis]|uniref:Mth938-like domain-containing protein n=1 Tax=Legionella spiritensis TaxID=452 RepID=UPI000F6C6CD4|nr:MTH938/NDUFAF3 family protein [Legionella spiritensis]VEG90039.1 Protein of uncharacterised function (DUF498/DUF598) [Legionella spiritensis]
MQISLDATDKYTIQAYSDMEIQINSTVYANSVIVSPHNVIEDWPVTSLASLNDETLLPLMKSQPEIILIGHKNRNEFPPASIRQKLLNQRIALESMSIGAACRTFNVLSGEERAVVLGIIL